MNDKVIARPNYFSGEALLTEDFKVEQQFHLDLLRYNNASLRTHGIARGLEVKWEKGVNQVQIGPGMAIDRLGREIILLHPQVIKLEGGSNNAPYFLTINYHEAYADLTEEPGSGIKGYKRIVQQPQFKYVQLPKDPGLNILLAVFSFGANSQINALSYKSGNIQRKYVGSILGSVQFVTEGTGVNQSGINNQHSVLSLFESQDEETKFSAIVAKRETSGIGHFLEVDAARTQFMGATTTRENLGIGVDYPLANLQLDAVTFKGHGTLSSDNQEVTFDGKMSPFLAVNDIIISDPQAKTGPKQQRRVTGIINIDNDRGESVFTVDKAFTPTLNGATFTYIRSQLACFSVGGEGSVLEVNLDGSVGLGNKSLSRAGQLNGGRNVLYISADRKVGIGLTDAEPSAELDVKGTITADALAVSGNVISDGVVKANSFEGNGEKLKNLPILSFWTKESVGEQASKLHYTEGNVGVQMVNPPASLSVGGGKSIVGKGFVSSGPDNTLIGYQTHFKTEVSYGDSITVGKIIPQPIKIVEIVSDTQLEIVHQVPFVVNNSGYQYLEKAGGDPAPGAGSISSNGTTIIGKDTKFKDLKIGGDLIVDQFVPENGSAQTWFVQKVESDNKLTLISRPKGNGKDDASRSVFVANDSAYMVTSALMAYVQATAKYSALTTEPGSKNEQAPEQELLPPALLVTANGLEDGMSPNTIAINTGLEHIKSQYALQVNGDVNFEGEAHFKDFFVETLTASKSITVNADNTADNILVVGESGSSPLLNVSKTNVQIGQQIAPSSDALDVKGDIHTSDNIKADKDITANNITAAQTLSGDMLTAKEMKVAGTTISEDSTVSIFGNRSALKSLTSSGSGSSHQETAPTDGFIIVTIGSINDESTAGIMMGQTLSDSTVTSSAVAASVQQTIIIPPHGKKSKHTSYSVNVPGSFSLPVRKGEQWKVSLTAIEGTPSNEFYFVPLGSTNNGGTDSTVLAASDPQSSYIPDMMNQLQQKLSHASTGGTPQEVINQRMTDLTSVLSKATPLKGDTANQKKFIHELSKIVCSVDAQTGEIKNHVDPQDINKLIATFTEITGKTFTPSEESLLRTGINALVQINANDANRNDLNLIKNNIDTFIDSLGTVLHTPFDKNQRRLLTRALVRLVGDGTQSPSDIAPAPVSVSTDKPQSLIKAFVKSAESTLGKTMSKAGRQAVERVIKDAIGQSKEHGQAVDDIVKSIEKAAGSRLKDDVRTALLSDIKKWLVSLF